MANNYLEFSVELKLKSKQLERVKEIIREKNEDVTDTWCSAADFELYENENSLLLYADEFGDPNQAANLIYQLIKEDLIEYDKYVLLTWAETCSKHRPDEFCGGAIMIHKDGIEWMPSPSTWAESHYLEIFND